MENKKYTIKDIAKLAGVSAGTVDRVMHGRGEVSETSRQKVQKVLDEINYQPNMFAIGLAAKKHYKVSCLIPVYSKDDYWSSVAEGIEKAASEMKAFNVSTDFYLYDHSSKASYLQQQDKLLADIPDAVLIAPNFRDETLRFAACLQEMQIPFVFIDVNPGQVNALQYIGQDSYQSGYIAAKILMREYTSDKELVLFLSNNRKDPSEFQMQRRLDGFMQFLHAARMKPNIHEVIIDRNDQLLTQQRLDLFFSRHKAVGCLGAVFNSRVYQVGAYLQSHDMHMSALLGYDLLPQNTDLLKSGTVNFLIGQRPRLQGYLGVKALTDKVVFKKEVSAVKYMPIDIMLKDNIDYYIELI